MKVPELMFAPEFGTKDGRLSVVNIPLSTNSYDKPDLLPHLSSTKDPGVVYEDTLDERLLEWHNDTPFQLQDALTAEAEDLHYRYRLCGAAQQESMGSAVDLQLQNKGKEVHQKLLSVVRALKDQKVYEEYGTYLSELKDSLQDYAERSMKS